MTSNLSSQFAFKIIHRRLYQKSAKTPNKHLNTLKMKSLSSDFTQKTFFTRHIKKSSRVR